MEKKKNWTLAFLSPHQLAISPFDDELLRVNINTGLLITLLGILPPQFFVVTWCILKDIKIT